MKLNTLKDITDNDLLTILTAFKEYVIKGDFKTEDDIKRYINFLRGYKNDYWRIR